MRVDRRSILGAAASAAMLATPLGRVAAQGTPAPEAVSAPGYGITRVRALPTPELNAAIIPDVLARFLPRTAAVPGYRGYAISQHASDPAATITTTLLDDEAAAADAAAVAMEYVAALDPRFAVETPFAAEGQLRWYQLTDRPASELPPFLHGCHYTMRARVNAPDVDMEAVIAEATEGLLPLTAAMPGFVLYCWIQTEVGRTAINIWETADHLAAGNEAIAAWVDANIGVTSVGDAVVNDGVIIYADFPQLS